MWEIEYPWRVTCLKKACEAESYAVHKHNLTGHWDMLGKGTDLLRDFCASTSTSTAPVNLIEKVFAVKFCQYGYSNQLEFKLSRGFSNVRPV